jgi:hypothetical protein
MPIDYSKYPPNWKTEIRPRILDRANNCCEWCKVPNGHTVVRDCTGHWHELNKYIDAHATESNQFLTEVFPGWDDKPEGLKNVKIVLTIAHLDHDEENHEVKDDRLAALCQRCHLRYDAPEKARRRRVKKYEGSMFPL